MPGSNRFALREFERKARTGPCVFVSHRRADSAPAKALADYLLQEVGVDVYFDGYDHNLAGANDGEDDNKVVDSVEAGLLASTHLLGVLSSKTRGSWWVPYEIGAARAGARQLGHVVLEEVRDLPSFMKKSKLIVDRRGLSEWAKAIKSEYLWEKALTRALRSSSIPGLPESRAAQPTFVSTGSIR